MSKMNRRRFLKLGIKGAAVALTPFDLITRLLLDGAGGKSYAAEAGAMRYFMIHQPYSPSRWMFDLLLNPFNDQNFKTNAQMGTILKTGAVADRYTATEYALQNMGGIHVPPMWGFNLPSNTTGTTRQLASLIPNMLHLRGIIVSQSHELSKDYLFLPVGATKTVSSLASERSSDPIPAVALHPTLPGRINTYIYRSPNGATAITLNSANYIKELTDAFSWPTEHAPSNSQFAEASAKLSREVEEFQAELDKELANENTSYDVVLSSRRDMRRLLSRGLGDPIQTWNQLLDKYSRLIRSVLTNKTFPGISDKIVGSQTGGGAAHLLGGLQSPTTDIRAMLDPAGVTVRGLAESFAAAEFIFTHNLSSSLVANHEHIIGLANPYQRIDPDQHAYGSLTTTYFNTMMFSALGACLLEFVEFLKGKGLYDSTLIEIASEFNRNPKAADGGADHASDAASSIFFSGSIKGPQIVGNISREDRPNSTYAGATYGNGVANAELGGGPLNPGHRAAVIAAVMGVTPPVASAKSAVKKEREGKIVPEAGIQPGKIIST